MKSIYGASMGIAYRITVCLLGLFLVTTSIAQAADDIESKAKIRIFQPKARVYFDTGSDDTGEVDIFQDGSLVPTINLLELYWPKWNWGWVGRKEWKIGPALGFGISAPAQDSDDGVEKASGAPVVMLSGGLLFEFPLSDSNNSTVGFEGGYVQGWSASESHDDVDDGAVYVGLTLNINFGEPPPGNRNDADDKKPGTKIKGNN